MPTPCTPAASTPYLRSSGWMKPIAFSARISPTGVYEAGDARNVTRVAPASNSAAIVLVRRCCARLLVRAGRAAASGVVRDISGGAGIRGRVSRRTGTHFIRAVGSSNR